MEKRKPLCNGADRSCDTRQDRSMRKLADFYPVVLFWRLWTIAETRSPAKSKSFPTGLPQPVGEAEERYCGDGWGRNEQTVFRLSNISRPRRQGFNALAG